jgi:hypothetical protein
LAQEGLEQARVEIKQIVVIIQYLAQLHLLEVVVLVRDKLQIEMVYLVGQVVEEVPQ